MYAYREQVQVKTYYPLPDNRVKRVHSVKRKIVRKKPPKNMLVEFFRLIVSMSFLCAFIIFVFPKAFNQLVKQVVLPDTITTEVKYNQFDKTSNPAFSTSVNLYTLAYPITNYINNDIFDNQLLLAPAVNKQHSEVSTMYSTSEMVGLKQQLLNLQKSYPSIKPSIYVWEFEQGKYIDIDSEKLYPAASIIKIPVLVRLFKSIEANQLTIFDEMKMLEVYRSSGSGNLQYAPANKTYTIDYLAKTMIQDSDNTSTNMIMAKLGGMNDINVGLRDWGISKTYLKTWLPDLKGTNKTTAKDIAKLLYNLDNPGFLNINSREYIIDYMSHVKNDRLIQAGLGAGAMFVHKTGDIGTMLGDAGIVYAPNGQKYIVVILAERPYNSAQGKDFIVNASTLIYNAIVK